MALVFDASYYISQRPDVFQAYIATAGQTGQSLAQYAENHYNQFGRFEGSNPNAIFNTNEYLAANPDVAASGVNPFQHYLQFGAAEGRAPSASFPTFASFDADTYLAANPDLKAAGITTKAQAYQHFVLYGEFENRPGTPAIVVNPGVSTPLTAAIEVKEGTTGNDHFTGVVSGNPGESTLQNGDSVVGKGGTDTLTATVVNGGNFIVADLTNIASLESRLVNGNVTYDLGTALGLKEVSVTGNGGGFAAAQNLDYIVGAKIANANGGNLQIQYNNAVTSGSSDVQNVSITNSTGSFAVSGIETVNVTATGANSSAETNVLFLTTAGDLKTLNVSGTGGLTLGNTLDSSVTVIDASKSTGGVELTVSNGSGAQTITGSAGNDVFHLGSSLTAADTVVGGAGVDRVIVDSVGDYTAAGNAAALAGINGVKGVEKLQFDNSFITTTVNNTALTSADVTTLAFSTAGNDVINNANAARGIEFDVGNSGSALVNLSAGVTAVDVTLNGTTGLAAVAKDGTSVAVNGLTVALSGTAAAGTTETLTLHSLGDLGTFDANHVGVINLAAGSKIVIDGKASLVIDGLTDHATVDASALATGQLSFHGSAFEGTAGTQTVVAPPVAGVQQAVTDSGVDTLTLSANKLTDTINFFESASANDSGTIVLSGTTAANNVTASGTIYHDVVAGFEAGSDGDILHIGNFLADNSYTALSAAGQTAINALAGAAETLYNAANAAADAHTASGWTAFSFQGTTYALHEGNADAAGGFNNGDTIVELTGVAVANLTTANFA